MAKLPSSPNPLSPIEFQVLLVLADGPSYGYAIMKAVEGQSDGRMKPEIGSLYRVISRLMTRGLVHERSAPKGSSATNRGLPRKYYGLTPAGSRVAKKEAAHLAGLVSIAKSRDLLPGG